MINFDKELTVNEFIQGSFNCYGLQIDEQAIEQYKLCFDGVSDWFLTETITEHLQQDPVNAPIPFLISQRLNNKINYFASTTEH